MSISKVQAESIDLTATYAFSGTVSDTAVRNLVLLQTLTASSSATLSFTSGINNTYQSYVFKFIDIHPSAATNLQFNGSIDTGSNYNVVKTSTFFQTRHDEDDSPTQLAYETGKDLAQGAGFQQLVPYVGIANDECMVGELELFDPSSTTFVKHFKCQTQSTGTDDSNLSCYGGFAAGYFNTTSAIDAIQFKMASGNIDSGIIKMYGVL